jgi:hypothetical protein
VLKTVISRSQSIASQSLVVFIGGFLFLTGPVFAKTASCPCSPCTCSPCTCGSGGKSGSKHHGKDDHHGKDEKHGHAGVGVGANVDLGGVGQRKAEADPFSVPVSNETPSPKTGEGKKKKEKKGKDEGEKGHKWPPAIQAWIEKTEAATKAHTALRVAQTNYLHALHVYCWGHSRHYHDLYVAMGDAFRKAYEMGATEEDKANYIKLVNDEKRVRKEMEPDFIKTPEAQQLSGNLNDAQKASDQANADAADAGKGIDQETKDAVHQEETQNLNQPAETGGPPPPPPPAPPAFIQYVGPIPDAPAPQPSPSPTPQPSPTFIPYVAPSSKSAEPASSTSASGRS